MTAVRDLAAGDFAVAYRHPDPAARWWKPGVATIALVIVYIAASIALSAAAMAIEVARDVIEPGELRLTPVVFAAAMVSLAILGPIAGLLYRLLYRRPARTLLSVIGEWRMRWFARSLAICIGAITASFASYTLVASMTAALWGAAPPTPDPLPWIAVGVIVMPFQALAEEIVFRGLLLRGIAGNFSSQRTGAVTAVVITGVLFGILHGASDEWLLAYYVGFGLLLGALAIATQGVEAPIALHVANNVGSAVVGSLVSDPSGGIDRSAGAGSPWILLHLAVLGVLATVLKLAYDRTATLSRDVSASPVAR